MQQGTAQTCLFLCLFVIKSSQAAEEKPVVIETWTGTLSSPGYPLEYPRNSSYTWLISVAPGNKIQITVHDLRTECSEDYLEFREGLGATARIIERHCGNSRPPSFVSFGSEILLRFVSDDVGNRFDRGFTLVHTGICTVHLNATSGIIATPNYPSKYPIYMDCLWTIALHPALQITLEFNDFALELEDGCRFDYAEILAGLSTDSPVVARYCGFAAPQTYTRQGNVSIRFVSDSDTELTGFLCTYSVIKVKGRWTEWTTWSDCSQTCHHGNQTRSRTCANPLPESHYELYCDGDLDFEARSCSISNCNDSTTPTAITHTEHNLYAVQNSASFTHQSLNVLETHASHLYGTQGNPVVTTQNHALHTEFGILSVSLPTPSMDFRTRANGFERLREKHSSRKCASATSQIQSAVLLSATTGIQMSRAHFSGTLGEHSQFTNTALGSFNTKTASLREDKVRGSLRKNNAEEGDQSGLKMPLKSTTLTCHASRPVLSLCISISKAVPHLPTDESGGPPNKRFSRALVLFLVVFLFIMLVLATYYLRNSLLVSSVIVAIKHRRKAVKETKPACSKVSLTQSNFSTAGFGLSPIHSQRDLFYDDTLNYDFFETGAGNPIEFSVRLDEELEHRSEFEEPAGTSCATEEEFPDQDPFNDSLSQLFDEHGDHLVETRNVRDRYVIPPADYEETKHTAKLFTQSPSTYDI